MKVKIGNKVFDSKKIPIMVIMDGIEKQHETTIRDGTTYFCVWPENFSKKEIDDFIKSSVETLVDETFC